MIKFVKSYKKGDTEIIMKQEDETYNVIRLVKNNQSNIVTRLDQESAMDTFDFFLDMELGNDK